MRRLMAHSARYAPRYGSYGADDDGDLPLICVEQSPADIMMMLAAARGRGRLASQAEASASGRCRSEYHAVAITLGAEARAAEIAGRQARYAQET